MDLLKIFNFNKLLYSYKEFVKFTLIIRIKIAIDKINVRKKIIEVVNIYGYNLRNV